MNTSIHPSPYHLLVWYKVKAISEILGLDERFIFSKFKPVFKTMYALAAKKYQCGVTWTREITDNKETYTPKFYREFEYFYGFEDNNEEVSIKNEQKLKELSEYDLLSHLFDIKQRLIDCEKNRLQGIKDVHEHNEKMLASEKDYTPQIFAATYMASTVSFMALLPLTLPVAAIMLASSGWITYEVQKDSKKSSENSIERSAILIKDAEIYVNQESSGRIFKDLFIHIFSGDDWREKLNIQKNKQDVLSQIKSTNYV